MAGCGPINIRPLLCATDSVSVCPDPATATNTPTQIVQGTTAAVVLPSNIIRKGFTVQNTGTTVIKLSFGSVSPTQTAYHVALSACSVADNGLGGFYSDDTFIGAVHAISSDPGGTLVVLEMS